MLGDLLLFGFVVGLEFGEFGFVVPGVAPGGGVFGLVPGVIVFRFVVFGPVPFGFVRFGFVAPGPVEFGAVPGVVLPGFVVFGLVPGVGGGACGVSVLPGGVAVPAGGVAVPGVPLVPD